MTARIVWTAALIALLWAGLMFPVIFALWLAGAL